MSLTPMSRTRGHKRSAFSVRQVSTQRLSYLLRLAVIISINCLALTT